MYRLLSLPLAAVLAVGAWIMVTACSDSDLTAPRTALYLEDRRAVDERYQEELYRLRAALDGGQLPLPVHDRRVEGARQARTAGIEEVKRRHGK